MDMTETKPSPTTSRSRRRLGKRRSTAEVWGSISDGLLAVLLVGSVLAVGTVHIPTLLAISALALIGAAVEVVALRRVPWPAVVLAGFGLFSAAQAISLPAGLVARVSPASATVWLRCLIPFGEPAPGSFSLSLDPSASIAEALKWVTYASVYVLAMRTRARRGSVWLTVLLFGSVTFVALVTLLHGIADLSELYGLYQPDFTPGRWNVGPLLNSNNLAGYAILGLFAGGALLVSGRSPLPRLAVMIGIGIISAALCLSGSRAGVLSALIAGALAMAGLVRARGTRVSMRGLIWGIAPIAIGAVIAVALGAGDQAGQFASLDVRRKVSVWLWSLPMIHEHALFGVGRGAFETAFQSYREALDYDWAIVITHAENFVVQWIAEWGVPVGLGAVVVIVGYVVREWYRSTGDRLRFVLMTGLVGLFLQNLADLGLEVPALAIAAVVALAAGERSAPPLADESAKRMGKLAVLGMAPAFALWVAAIVWSRMPVELERRQMSVGYGELVLRNRDESASADELAGAAELARVGELELGHASQRSTSEERAQFRTRLRQAVLRHPSEAFFPLLGALVAGRTRNGNALTWIARSLELAPTNGPVHLVLAELMQSHGATAQAMLHLRLAARYDHTLAGAVSTRAAAWAPSVDVLMQAIPDGSYGEGVLLDACPKEQQIELKLDCFRRASQRSPGTPRFQLALAESLLTTIHAGLPPCKDQLVEQCAAEAEVAIRSAGRADPTAWRPGYLLSKVLLARGDTVGAAQLLTRTCPANFEGDECWHDALSLAIKGGATDAISKAANALATKECDGMESCANMYSALASELEAGGQPTLASKFYIKAAEAEPSAARWLQVAELAAKVQLNGVARAALDRANRSFDASASTRASVEQLRQRVARTTGGSP